MSLSALIVEFMLFSFAGWVYESLLCTIQSRQWQNRGFLFGPVCPIYGSCAAGGHLLLCALSARFNVTALTMPLWQLFLIGMIGSAIVEYLTSWVLEARFHARWWDYSQFPLNLNGRISLPTSAGFGLAGVVIARVLLPLTEAAFAGLPAVLTEFMALLFVGLMGADIALTEASLSDLMAQIEHAEAGLNRFMEARYQAIEDGGTRIMETGAALRDRLSPSRFMRGAQRHLLKNIRKFRSEERNTIANRLRELLGRKSAKEGNDAAL